MKLFYTNYGTNQGIDSVNAKEVNLEQAINIFLELVDEPDSFLGFIDAHNTCIQFVNEESRWLLDIPVPPNFENLQAYLSDKECIAVIEDIFTRNQANTNVKLYKVNIMNETLDDVLAKE